MFGFGKKKLIKKMNRLANTAMIAVYLSLKEKYAKSMQDEEAVRFAACIANYLFGKPPDPMHYFENRSEEIKKTGDTLIRLDPGIRKLVIQSLRVLSMIYKETGNGAVENDILSNFGKEYPEAPTPESYRLLVAETVSSMSPFVKSALSGQVSNN